MKAKKILILILTLAFTLSFGVSFSAAEVNNELAKLKLYIREQIIQPQTAEENVIYAKTSLIYAEIEANVPEVDMTSAESIADTLCAIIALNGLVEELPYDVETLTSALIAMQDEESGAFGNSILDSCKSIIALMAAEAEFDVDKAIRYVIKSQNYDDGSFREKLVIPVSYDKAAERMESELSMRNTYWAVAALSAYTSTNSDLLEKDSLKQQIINEAKKSVNKAVDYVKSYIETEETEFASPVTVAYAILILTDAGKVAETDEFGNLMSFLLKFANEDGSFRASVSGEESFDREATMMALRALEAIRYSASEYKSLAVNGGFNQGLDLEGLKPMLTIVGVIAALSVVMWVVIFLIKKPGTQTLEEFKAKVKEKLPQASEEEMDISKIEEKEEE